MECKVCQPSIKYTSHFRTHIYIPYKQSTQGARGCSGQIYNFRGWHGHSHHTWEQTGRSNLYGSMPSHLSHENLNTHTHGERPQQCCKLNTDECRGENSNSSSSNSPSGPKKAPHWAQKKCSGCHVLSRAVTTFCRWEKQTFSLYLFSTFI